MITCIGEPADDPSLQRAAIALATELNLPTVAQRPDEDHLQLVITHEALELRVLSSEQEQLVGGHALRFDWLALDIKSNFGRSLKQPLARAVGLGKKHKSRRKTSENISTDATDQMESSSLKVLDTTTGLGEDAWLLAAWGCEICCIERQPIVMALLRDALRRAAMVEPAIAARMQLIAGNAIELLRGATAENVLFSQGNSAIQQTLLHADVICMDPMFPGHKQRKTLERKPLRVLRKLVGDDGDADELFALALRVARQRVVVKRPLHAPILQCADLLVSKPDIVFEGRGYRYDVYLRHVNEQD